MLHWYSIRIRFREVKIRICRSRPTFSGELLDVLLSLIIWEEQEVNEAQAHA